MKTVYCLEGVDNEVRFTLDDTCPATVEVEIKINGDGADESLARDVKTKDLIAILEKLQPQQITVPADKITLPTSPWIYPPNTPAVPIITYTTTAKEDV